MILLDIHKDNIDEMDLPFLVVDNFVPEPSVKFESDTVRIKDGATVLWLTTILGFKGDGNGALNGNWLKNN